MPLQGRVGPRALAVTAAALAVVIAALLLLRHPQRPADTYFGTALDPPKAATDFVLTGADGATAHVLDSSARLTFLFFGYTHCPDECPLALASLARAYHLMPAAARAGTRIVFVSVDPARDTPAVVGRYVAAFRAPIAGLTGTESALKTVWNAYGVRVDAKSRETLHGDTIYAIDRTNRIILVYPPDAHASDLASDAAKVNAGD